MATFKIAIKKGNLFQHSLSQLVKLCCILY